MSGQYWFVVFSFLVIWMVYYHVSLSLTRVSLQHDLELKRKHPYQDHTDHPIHNFSSAVHFRSQLS